MKKILLSVVALMAIFSVYGADKVSFKADAPMTATVGERFRVSFTVNAKPDSGTLTAPSFEGFDLLAGPTTSSSSSVQIINGKTTSKASYGYTYVLVPEKAGTFTIGSASISVGGKKYTSKPIDIEVRASNQSSGKNSTPSVGKEDLMFRLELSKKSAYKGEPIRAVFKLYTRVDVARYALEKSPSFDGFWSQNMRVRQNPYRETLNDKVYVVYNVDEYVLYPQQDGTLTIEPAELDVDVYLAVESNHSYSPFHGSGYEILQVNRKLKTPAVKVNVKPFPAGAPASFSGAVGHYTMSHELSSEQVPVNESATLRLTISGSGNLNFVSEPQVSFPDSFELYDVKRDESIENSTSGSRGYRSFEYPFIVRAEGEYEIAPVEFSYFDLDKQQYETLSTGPLKVVVTPGKSGVPSVYSGANSGTARGNSKQDVQVLNEDIHYIKRTTELCSVVAPLVLSSTYWWIIAALFVAAVLTYMIVRKRMKDSSNEVLVRGRRANRVAVKRFRVAARYMRENNRSAFYEEMLHGLWGYLSDRFNIPIADLTREIVREELQKRGATAEAEMIIAVIARCEEAQYSPVATSEMESAYEEGVEAVSKIEKIAK